MIFDDLNEALAPSSPLSHPSPPPLSVQVLVTLEQTVLGFLIGAVLGVISGVILGRNQLLADVFSIYIKIAKSIFIIALGLGMASKVALAVVMVFFVVFGECLPGRARG
jgi:NitT/TauT family transport system permease protein